MNIEDVCFHDFAGILVGYVDNTLKMLTADERKNRVVIFRKDFGLSLLFPLNLSKKLRHNTYTYMRYDVYLSKNKNA